LAFGEIGLDVLLPLPASAFDAACAQAGLRVPLRLGDLAPGAKHAAIVGGGRGFFAGFTGAPEAADGAPSPLDRFTRRMVAAAAERALEPLRVRHAVFYPFGGAPLIPFQRLGRAAGLGPPGPLGLQIHPTLGPWWAYRALVTVDRDLPAVPALGDSCRGCPAPCVAACPAGAVREQGFAVAPCHARRVEAEGCRLSCPARIACVRGPEHRYSDAALAFHMAASLPRWLPPRP
jgi:epoxyqueuosine reductase